MKIDIWKGQELDNLVKVMENVEKEGAAIKLATLSSLHRWWALSIENIITLLEKYDREGLIEALKPNVKDSIEAARNLSGFVENTLHEKVGLLTYPSKKYLDNLLAFGQNVQTIYKKISSTLKNKPEKEILGKLLKVYCAAINTDASVTVELRNYISKIKNILNN